MLLLIWILIGTVIVHLFKMMRLYLVLMEHKMPFLRFVLLYVRTTFINLAIPFKLGELYRMEEIARETKIWQVGILSVVIDRFFDTVALTLILLPIDLLIREKLSALTLVFLLCIILLVFAYLVFPASYGYLNRYLIVKHSSKKSMLALKGLDVAKIWFDFTSQLIKGRFALILSASFLGWTAELGVLTLVARKKELAFTLADFVPYMEANFLRGSSALLVAYTQIGLGVLFVGAVVGYLMKMVHAINKKAQEKQQYCVGRKQ